MDPIGSFICLCFYHLIMSFSNSDKFKSSPLPSYDWETPLPSDEEMLAQLACEDVMEALGEWALA